MNALLRLTPSIFPGPLTLVLATALVAGPAAVGLAQTPVLHKEYQAVNASGASAFNGSNFYPDGIVMTGIVLNNPSDMFDPTANYNTIPFNLGGQWQIFIQAYDNPNDFGGTTLWMGQNYGNLTFKWGGVLPVASYTNTEWEAEVQRLDYPSGFGVGQLQAGDVIQVVAATGLEYKGKRNINENHDKDPDNNFIITRIAQGQTLPTATPVALADLMTTAKSYYFDATRSTGPEHLQGGRVEVRNVRYTGGVWAPGNTAYVTDDLGREFPLHLGLDTAFTAAPPGVFSVTGIFDQESYSSTFIDGYSMWVMHPGDVVSGGLLNRWTGDTGNSWSGDSDWLVGQAPNAPDAIARFYGPQSGSVNLAGDATVGQLELDNSAAGFTLGGAGTLKFKATALAGVARQAKIDVLAGDHEVSADISFDSNTEIDTSTGAQLAISGDIDGSGRLTKSGDGTLVLSGINHYGGGTTVAAGTLEIANFGALPAGRSLSIGSGGTLILGGGQSLGQAATMSPQPVPEPATFLLVVLGGLAMVPLLRCRRV